MPLERKKNLIKSLIENGNIHDALRVCTQAYPSDFTSGEYLEVFIDGIVKIARGSLGENKKITFDSFLCTYCGDIFKDPVTLKCGHTLSKKCVLSEAESKNGSFTCPKCCISYSFIYVSQLKNNVAYLAVVEKLYDKLAKYKSNILANEDHLNKIYEARRCFVEHCDNNDVPVDNQSLSFTLFALTSSQHFKKGSILFNLGNYEESFKALLTSYTLDASALSAKFLAVKVFRKILLSHPCSYQYQKATSFENIHIQKKDSLDHSENNLQNAGSSVSLHAAENYKSSEDEEKAKVKNGYPDSKGLHSLIDSFFDCIKNLGEERSFLSRINVSGIDKEFDCPLCMRILLEPVTTTCGHTFCRDCLNRCFDHQPNCPLCKTSLASFLAEGSHNTTEFLELAVKNLLPTEYAERLAIYLEEMEKLSKAGKDSEHEIPLFVCTVSLPTVPCPLHVFEPRYRLMIRRCMESGSRQFGMCGVVDDEIADVGTMLEIRDVKYFPDGRSIVDTVGRKRFRILRQGERDGYHTGAVEFLEDEPLSDSDLLCIEEKLNRTYNISKIWFMHLPSDVHHQILQHYGPMPLFETDYLSSPDGPSWLWWMFAILPVESRFKVLLLSIRSLPRRLEFLNRILTRFQSARSLLAVPSNEPSEQPNE